MSGRELRAKLKVAITRLFAGFFAGSAGGAGAFYQDGLYYFGIDRQTEEACRIGRTHMGPELNRRQSIVLAALATESGAEFAPVQVQKLFFLIDENVHGLLGGKQFSFEPYDYGPFDKDVYEELDTLTRLGFVRVFYLGSGNGHRRYTLTPAGQSAGEQALLQLQPSLREYFKSVSQWVRSMGFAQLVGAIYNAYPNMRVNSVFRG